MYFSESHGIDLTPSEHWPQFTGDIEPALHEGPILIVAEYSIDPGPHRRIPEGYLRTENGPDAGRCFPVESLQGSRDRSSFYRVVSCGVMGRIYAAAGTVHSLGWRCGRYGPVLSEGGEPVIIRHFVAQPLKKNG